MRSFVRPSSYWVFATSLKHVKESRLLTCYEAAFSDVSELSVPMEFLMVSGSFCGVHNGKP